MFGKGKRERDELHTEFVTLGRRLDAMQKELSELRDETKKELSELRVRVDAQPREEESEDMNSLVNKWINGEKGDGR